MDKILSNKVYILSAIRRSEMSKSYSKVKVWSEKVSIPTYGVGKPDKNPMFCFLKKEYIRAVPAEFILIR